MLEEHLGYVADRKRLELFNAAIHKALHPGDRVLDLGCGTGVLGLMCLKAGAAHVVAVDSTSMLEVARETFARAGVGDQVELIRGHSHQIELSRPVDLVICDQVGFFGFDYGIVHTLADARRRFLRDEGTMIPMKIRLEIAAVASEDCLKKTERWRAEHVPHELRWIHRLAVNAKYDAQLGGDDLASDAAELGEIDLTTENPEFFSWTAKLRVNRGGPIHGLAGWFRCELADGVEMTNSPLSESSIDRPQAFLPFDDAVEVSEGDPITATIMTRPADHQIAWVAEFSADGLKYSHSSLEGLPVAPEDLVRSHPDHVPELSVEGRALATVLSYCDGVRSHAEIEQAVLQDHPDLLPSPEEVARFVAVVLGRNTE